MTAEVAGSGRRASSRVVLLSCLAMFGVTLGQQMINPILAPLTRELGLSELHLGILLTVGASGVVLISPLCARLGAAWGYRNVLMVSLIGTTVGLLGFAAVAQVGLAGQLSVPLLFALIVLTRGVVFGLAWAATPVMAQSAIADATVGEVERIRGMSRLGAAQGLGLAVGPALGGLLVFGGLLTPLYAAPLMIAVIAVAVAVGLPRTGAHRERAAAVAVRPFDPRVWPFLAAGFGMFLSFAIVMTTIGFLLQDRSGFDAEQTGSVTGLVMLAGAGAMILMQAVVVPRLAWSPNTLIRVGVIVMAFGMVAITASSDLVLLIAGLALIGTGMGLGLPGVMSAPTLIVAREEQGAVAGLVNSSNALSFVFGPLAGTALYEVAPKAPYILGIVILGGLVAFTHIHSRTRR